MFAATDRASLDKSSLVRVAILAGVALLIAALAWAPSSSAALSGSTLGLNSPEASTPAVVASPAVTPEPSPSPSPTLNTADPSSTSHAPTETTPATVLPASAPVNVRIPSLGVDSTLMDLGLESDGTLSVPPTAHPAGWYTGAPTPGELGPAIIAGHVDYRGEAGVFHDLHHMKVGDEVLVERADGTTAVFLVTDVQQHAKDKFPTNRVYGDIDHAGIRLITCGGVFDRNEGSHRDNIIVFAELAGTAK